jgi:hypothetical protein
MNYILKQRADMQAIIIEACGIINTGNAKNMVLDTGLKLKDSGFQRCLFDLLNTHIDPNQTMTEMFMFVDTFKQAGIDRSIRMAAVYTTGGKYRLFLEKCMVLEGYHLKHFTDRNKAVNWLCQ